MVVNHPSLLFFYNPRAIANEKGLKAQSDLQNK
jgi:hypothetical protein